MTVLHTYKMRLAYDGTQYGGWQVQPHTITIQQLVQETLTTVLRFPTHATGAGRTDAGVHACGQCAHFQTQIPIDCCRLRGNLNGLLPAAIRIQEIEAAPPDFHARYSATGKVYRYYLTLGPYTNPFTRLYSWHIPFPFDRTRTEEAAALFVGTHDFCSFANQRGSTLSNTVRTIRRLDCVSTPDGLYYEFEGPGFLYKMVRNIVGTLVDSALGKRSFNDIPLLLAARDRRTAGNAAPAHGLFLMQVLYPFKSTEGR